MINRVKDPYINKIVYNLVRVQLNSIHRVCINSIQLNATTSRVISLAIVVSDITLSNEPEQYSLQNFGARGERPTRCGSHIFKQLPQKKGKKKFSNQS
uniref:Uncharacterized protein n=1 Tax=Loa loa TaxID=7209 RepID=A0A1I7W2S0_LOALO